MIEQQSLKTFIKIAGMDIPVHLAWKKIEVLNTAADHLDRLNEEYPHLSTKFSCEILIFQKSEPPLAKILATGLDYLCRYIST